MPEVLVQLNSLALGGSQINAVDLEAATADHGYECVLVRPRSTLPDGPSLIDVAAERGVRLETFERATTPHGGRDLADPRPAYSAAEVVVGMGGPAARGLAFGKALIVRGEGGWFRTFEPASAAALFRANFWSDERDPDPVGDLAAGLEPLIREPVLRAELGRFGRRFAVEHFGLPALAEHLTSFYDRTLRTYRAGDWWRDLPTELEYLPRRALAGRIPASRRPGAPPRPRVDQQV
jgi:hypothetical protein